MSKIYKTANEFADCVKRGEDLCVIDLRTPAEVSQESLENCVFLPVHEVSDERLDKLIAEKKIDASLPIHLLCQSGKRAEMALEKLAHRTDISMVILEGGLNAIKQTGIETKKSAGKIISLERQVRIAAGVLVLLFVALGFALSEYFFLGAAAIGAGLTYAGITDNCGMAMVLARMPWNTKG